MEKDIVNIGKSVVIKGELNGSEDLTIEGHVEGTIQLRDHVLTIGPNGRIKAQVFAKAVIVLGEVTGIKGAHGTAIADATGHGFATSGTDESVVIFDLKTFKVLDRIHTAEDTDAIIQKADASQHVLVMGGSFIGYELAEGVSFRKTAFATIAMRCGPRNRQSVSARLSRG